jgi:hypothetical protein
VSDRASDPSDLGTAAAAAAEVAEAAEDDAVNVIAFAQIGASLADQAIAAIPAWVQQCVRRFIDDPDDGEVRHATELALSAIDTPLRNLLAADIDQQRGTPLNVIRQAVEFPTAVLAAHNIEPVERDPFAERSFPADLYDLSPGSWSDIDPSLADIGLRWSVAKAFLHRQRHAT